MMLGNSLNYSSQELEIVDLQLSSQVFLKVYLQASICLLLVVETGKRANNQLNWLEYRNRDAPNALSSITDTL
jgi:hypothetical protein